MFSPLEQFEILIGWKFYFFWYEFFYLPSPVIPWLAVFLFFQGFFLFYGNTFKVVPPHWQFLLEFFFFFFFNLVKQQLGLKGVKFFLLISSFFFFIFFTNLLSLTPFVLFFTSYFILLFFLFFIIILFTLLECLLIFIVFFFFLFVPEAPFLLLFLLIPIELFSYSIRALSLAIRLSANIIAGHTLVFILSNFLMVLFRLEGIFFLLPLFFLWSILSLDSVWRFFKLMYLLY